MRHLHIPVLAVVLALGGFTASLSAARQTQPARPAVPAAPQRPQPPSAPAQPPAGFVIEQIDARETQQRLRDVLNQYPPSVREVLRIDPTLLYRPEYLATYPALSAFLEQHPEIAHNPGFFLGEWRPREEQTPSSQGFRTLEQMSESLLTLLIIMTITTGIIWVVRTAIEHRRWQRAMRAQTELNTKLIDRFSSSEELLAYLQSPAGKTLIEPAALPHASPMPLPMNAPLTRIFWSLQSGIVVAALGTGLIIVSSSAIVFELQQFLHGAGIVLLLIGVGFTISAAVSFFLSQRLGLVQPASARFSGEAPGA
jgi:hypothetical protein